MEDIPVKLRCAACNKLATNAFRQSSLPQACPICLHEPVKAEDCRPNKTLRMTIKAFLKKLMTEREKAQKKQAADKAAAVPAAAKPSEKTERRSSQLADTEPINQPAHDDRIAKSSKEASTVPPSADSIKGPMESGMLPTEAQKDVPQPSIEAAEDNVHDGSLQEEQPRGDGVAADQAGPEKDGSQQPQNQQNTQGTAQQWPNPNGVAQGMNGVGFGMDSMNVGFPNMSFANPADFASMMQFMPNNAMAGFPNMMGMPGMGMDPMQAMSQGMFGGFGGPGMGMNGMNAGMGFPAGQGWNGGFNGQPGSWMSGQDKFNQNAYGGHANGMGGDFGASSGFAGYNVPSHQGNYNQMNHHQFPNHDFHNGYHGQGFHNRGRGRGRGYSYAARGRGGYNQVMPGNQTNHESFRHQYSSQTTHQEGSHSQYPRENENNLVDEFGRDKTKIVKPVEATDEQIAREFAPGDTDDIPEAPVATAPEEANISSDPNSQPPKSPVQKPTALPESNESDIGSREHVKGEEAEEKPSPIETFVSDEQIPKEPTQSSPTVNGNTMMPPPTPTVSQALQSTTSFDASHEYTTRARGFSRGLPRGPADPQGIGRGRGHPLDGNTTNHVRPGYQPAPAPVVIAPIEPKGLGVEGAPKGPKAMREGLPNTGIRGGRGFSIVGRASSAAHGRSNGHVRSRSRSASRSRSPSRHRSHHHRSHRHRSPSTSESSDLERERRRERHHRRSRKYENSDEEKEAGTTSTHRSSHRSRRDRSTERDEDHSTHHRSHRSRREREQDGESRSNRKRSRTPSQTDDMNHSIKTTDPSSASLSSRKRRERDYHRDEEEEEIDQQRRERKRSRREYDEEQESQHHRTNPQSTDKPSSSRYSETQSSQSSRHHHHNTTSRKASTSSISIKDPEAIDPHELERQARNKERMQKELQRRVAMEGKGLILLLLTGERSVLLEPYLELSDLMTTTTHKRKRPSEVAADDQDGSDEDLLEVSATAWRSAAKSKVSRPNPKIMARESISPPPRKSKLQTSSASGNKVVTTDALKSCTPEFDDEGKSAGHLIPSPIQLSTVNGLAATSNIDTVSLKDVLCDPVIRECWLFNYLFDVDFVMYLTPLAILESLSDPTVGPSWTRIPGIWSK
ncbi:MAG: hypothetical protein Q9219_003264 [cf. Caloplaca sp. 3 TL-2023]